MLPSDFIFSQNSLQHYVDCKRRFFLEEIEGLDWPANQSEPVRIQEERMKAGTLFHLLCRQYLTGIPAQVIEESIDSDEMTRWWRAFLSLGLQPSGNLWPEKAITLPFSGFRLTAHFDLLLQKPTGQYAIYDWKTNLKQPAMPRLAERMQTKIYPLVLHTFLAQQGKAPEEIEMTYWYPEFPQQPQPFRFDAKAIAGFQVELQRLIEEIAQNPDDDFAMTEHLATCRYCQYRSYCNRGTSAGEFNEQELFEV